MKGEGRKEVREYLWEAGCVGLHRQWQWLSFHLSEMVTRWRVLNRGKMCSSLFVFLKIFKNLFIFRESGKEGWKRRRETLMCEKNIDLLPLAHPTTRDLAHNPACALTGNWTGDLWVCGMTPNLQSHISQVYILFSRKLSPAAILGIDKHRRNESIISGVIEIISVKDNGSVNQSSSNRMVRSI